MFARRLLKHLAASRGVNARQPPIALQLHRRRPTRHQPAAHAHHAGVQRCRTRLRASHKVVHDPDISPVMTDRPPHVQVGRHRPSQVGMDAGHPQLVPAAAGRRVPAAHLIVERNPTTGTGTFPPAGLGRAAYRPHVNTGHAAGPGDRTIGVARQVAVVGAPPRRETPVTALFLLRFSFERAGNDKSSSVRSRGGVRAPAPAHRPEVRAGESNGRPGSGGWEAQRAEASEGESDGCAGGSAARPRVVEPAST